jgi:predicted N-acetyltransferase YhbS
MQLERTPGGVEKRLSSGAVLIRPLVEADLATADRVMRSAFGTFLGLPEPNAFMGDAGYVAHRHRMDPSSAFAAVVGGEVVGSIFAARWGSVGFFGPLTVRPDLWDLGIGRKLMEPILARLDAWKLTHTGLFTFAHSPKHVGFYQTLGFWPRYLTAVMARPVWTPPRRGPLVCLSELGDAERVKRIDECRRVANAVYPGLDLTSEIEAVRVQSLGDTIIVEDGGEVAAFAVCHVGPRTEAGSGTCYAKFAAVRPGADAARFFANLLDACAAFAQARAATTVVVGVNTARRAAYGSLLERDFRTVLQGVTMHKPDAPAYSRPEIFVLDDWR